MAVTETENLKFAGGSPVAGYFFLFRQEKVTKKKATPVRCPFGVQVSGNHHVLDKSS
jgi:hypothetical protein